MFRSLKTIIRHKITLIYGFKSCILVPDVGPQRSKQVALFDYIIKDLLCMTVIYIPLLRWTGGLKA